MNPPTNYSLLSKQFMGKAALLLPFLTEESVTDILINGTHSLYLERDGILLIEKSPFDSLNALHDLIERLLLPIGKRIDASQPYIDGRCVDGSRFHIVLPPIAVRGPFISIRKAKNFEKTPLSSFADPKIVDWLISQVSQRKNMLIAGGTGSGKTTLLSRLLERVPHTERITVIEESMEIKVNHPHSISLEARPPSPDGKGEVTLRSLIRNALRMRPDRVVVGEARGEEAFDMLQAMNTGHPGSLSTIHANGSLDALKRLESLVLLSGFNIPIRAIREWISSGIQVVVFLKRAEGGRKIAEILQLTGLEGDVYRFIPKYKSTA